MKKPKKSKKIFVEGADYPVTLVEAERQFATTYLITSLWLHQGNVLQTALTLGVSRRTLQIRILDLRINSAKLRKDSQALAEEGDYELEDFAKYVKRGRK